MGQVCEWSGVARWERCVSGVRWQGGKGGRIVRWHGQRGGDVMSWQIGKNGRGSEQRRWDGIQGQNYCVVLLQGSEM